MARPAGRLGIQATSEPAKPGMYRSLKSGDFSDISNLSWAKDAMLAQAIREIACTVQSAPKTA